MGSRELGVEGIWIFAMVTRIRYYQFDTGIINLYSRASLIVVHHETISNNHAQS
jgi:hypothetical protein